MVDAVVTVFLIDKVLLHMHLSLLPLYVGNNYHRLSRNVSTSFLMVASQSKIDNTMEFHTLAESPLTAASEFLDHDASLRPAVAVFDDATNAVIFFFRIPTSRRSAFTSIALWFIIWLPNPNILSSSSLVAVTHSIFRHHDSSCSFGLLQTPMPYLRDAR